MINKLNSFITGNSERLFVKAKHPVINFFLFSLILTVLSRLAMFLWYVIAIGPAGSVLECVCGRWDNGWYTEIINGGYNLQPHAHEMGDAANWAFFPLVPMLIRALTLGGALDFRLVGFIFNSLILIFAVTIGYKYIMLDDGDASTAVGFSVFSICGPYTFYYSCLYTESVFMLLTLTYLYELRRERYIAMGIVGALLSATRVTGVLMVFVTLVYVIMKHVSEKRGGIKEFLFNVLSNGRLLIGVCLVPMGLFLYMLYLRVHMGDSLAFMRIQIAWGRTGVYLWGYIRNLITSGSYVDFHYFLVFIFIITVAVYQFRRKAYEALPYFFPCLINFISMGFMNLGRYSIGAGISVIGFIRMIKEHLSASARMVLYVLLAVMSLILQYGWFMNYPITVG